MNSAPRLYQGLSALLLLAGIATCPMPSALSANTPAHSQDSAASYSVRGLSLLPQSTNVALTWPSDPRESFLILVRSNPVPEAHWTILTNHMPAAAATNRTTFLDLGGATRPRLGPLTNRLADFYSVIVIPDFWSSPAGALLDGGPHKSGADFLPIYTGSTATDPFERPFNLHVDMLVDTERASEDEAIDLRAAVDDSVEHVNLGTAKQPRWAYSDGFWLQHDQLTNGTHTLQLRTLLTLNILVGPGEQFLTIANPSVRVLTAKAPAGKTGSEVTTQGNAGQSWWSQRLPPGFRRKTQDQATPEAASQHKLIARPLDLAAPPH